jgi:thioredoxin 1
VNRLIAGCVYTTCLLALAGCPKKETGTSGTIKPSNTTASTEETSETPAAAGAFTASTIDEGKQLAAAATPPKLVILDFTADWCPPCKEMEKHVWTDERVIGWMREHAVGVKIDHDTDTAAARDFAVDALPTIVILSDGHEISRVRGKRDANQLLTWFEKVADSKQ